MSGAALEGLQTVVLSAAERGTEIVVINASFEKVASGIGALTLALARGVYKARFKAGDRIADELFEVAGEAVQVHGPALAFSSPIPLKTGSNTHEYQRYPARHLFEGKVTGSLGAGAQLFVFARDSTHAYGAHVPGAAPWDGLALRVLSSGASHEIAPLGIVDLDGGSLGAKLSAAPGVYLLGQPDALRPGLALELPITLCQGWCTNVFLDAVDLPLAAASRPKRLNLGDAAVFMARIGSTVDGIEDSVHLGELARQAFMRGQGALSEADLQAMIDGKLEFPLLGLYACHALLARPEPAWDHVDLIANHLNRWLESGHPDVDVLVQRTQGALQRWSPRLWPPMLAASWTLALRDGKTLDPEAALLREFGQYRVAGSMWNCALRPLDAELPAPPATAQLTPAPSVFSFPEWAELAAASPAQAEFAVSSPAQAEFAAASPARPELAPAPQPVAPPAPDSAGFFAPFGQWLEGAVQPSIQAVTQATGASASLIVNALAPLTSSVLAPAWGELLPALRGLTLAHSPFQQALRRRVLNLLSDPDDDGESLDLEGLARQFHLPLAVASAALEQLHRDAQAALRRE